VILRFLSTSGVRVVLAAAQLLLAGGAFADEKTMPPLSGGVPMIEEIRMLEAGVAAPDFAIKDTDGKLFDFGEEKGKAPSLLVFWSIFCEPCRIEMPIVQRLHEKHRDALTVLAIALDGEPLKDSIAGFVKQEGYTFRVLIDELDEKETFKVTDSFGVGGTPTIFLVEKGGKISLAKVGRVKEEDLEKAVRSLLKK